MNQIMIASFYVKLVAQSGHDSVYAKVHERVLSYLKGASTYN